MMVRFPCCHVPQAGYDVNYFGGKGLGVKWIYVMDAKAGHVEFEVIAKPFFGSTG